MERQVTKRVMTLQNGQHSATSAGVGYLTSGRSFLDIEASGHYIEKEKENQKETHVGKEQCSTGFDK